MHEIELKAHVTDRAKTEKTLNSFAVFTGSAEKSDAYWVNPDQKPEAQTVRVRFQQTTGADGTENEETFVTCKRKEVRDGVEINDETEFTVSSKNAFERFLTDSGYVAQRVKHKSTKSWFSGDAHIELCAVPPLGDFIEIEILSPSDDVQTVESCRERLYDALAKSGVDKSLIEPAYYSELLQRTADT